MGRVYLGISNPRVCEVVPGHREITDPRVRAVAVRHRPLIVLQPEAFGESPGGVEDGAVVWFRPPADAQPDEVAAFKRTLAEDGAARVVALAPEVADSDLNPGAVVEPEKDVDLRAVVQSLVDVVAPDIRSDVVVVVEAALARAGL